MNAWCVEGCVNEECDVEMSGAACDKIVGIRLSDS